MEGETQTQPSLVIMVILPAGGTSICTFFPLEQERFCFRFYFFSKVDAALNLPDAS